MRRKISKFFGNFDRLLRSFINTVMLENCPLFCFSILIVNIVLISIFHYYALLTIHQAMILGVTTVAALVAIFTFTYTHRANTIRYYAEGEVRVLEFARNFPQLIDTTQIKYRNFEIGSEDFLQYESLAHQSLNLCWEMYNEPFWNHSLRIHFIAFFERIRRLHWDWLNDNESLFTKDFVSYMKTANWRNLVDPDQADHLRWIYEVDSYDKIVMSPMHPKLQDTLFSKIDESILKHSDSRSTPHKVADMGCGNGKLVKWLAQRDDMAKVIGIDYSANMIRSAKETVEGLSSQSREKTNIVNCDLRDLSQCKNKFDIVFSINSILPRNPDDMPVILKQISSTIRTGGLFISILPSFDTVLELKKLDKQKLIEKYERDERANAKKLAEKEVNKIYKAKKLDEEHGVYADDGVNPQRFFKEIEMDSLLNSARLSKLRLEKFFYPWDICRQYGWGDHPSGTPECVYDWFLVARKE